MKYSFYNLETLLDDGSIAVYNSITSSLVVMSKQELVSVKELSIQPKMIEVLKKQGIIVDDDVDEYRRVEYINFLNRGRRRTFFRILTTMNCNANCEYCYEKKNELIMDEKLAEDVKCFMEAKAKKGDSFKIEWFGGEPLLNYKAIDQISTELREDGYDSFEAQITTNGILFNEELIKTAYNKWGIRKTQITVDGVDEEYLRKKGLKDKKSFEKLCNNIEMLAHIGVDVSIRMNYDGRKEDFEKLLEYFQRRYGYNEYISYYFYPVFSSGKKVSREVVTDVINLNERIIDLGLSTLDQVYNISYRPSRCMATSNNSYTIGADGKIYNCTHTMESEGDIGSIYDYSEIAPQKIAFAHYLFSEECKGCKLLPVCAGGCRAAELGLAQLNQCNVYEEAFDLYIKQRVKIKGGKNESNR